MGKYRKTILTAVVLLIAAAACMFRKQTADPKGLEFSLSMEQTEMQEETAEEGREDNPEEQESSGGFTELQKQELEELIRTCLEEQMNSRMEAAVENALAENLNAMLESGKLPQAVTRYQEVQSGLININTADVSELTRLNGIGEAKAQAIVSYREENGGFRSVDELVNISGISSGIVEKLRDQVTL